MKPNQISSRELPELDTDVRQQDSEQNRFPKLSQWLLSLLILGGGLAIWQFLIPESVPSKAQITQSVPPAKPVIVATLMKGESKRKVKLLGQAEAGEKATLSPQIDGTVKQILVKEGDRIREGMVIAILDEIDAKLALAEAKAKLAQEQSNLDRLQVGTRPEIIAQRQAQLQSAQAREKEAQDNLTRIISLQEEGAISERALVEAQSGLDAARSERLRIQAILAEAEAGPTAEEIEAQKGLVDVAQARVKQAELALKRTEIKAPFSGIIQSRNVDTGDYVEINDPLVTLVSDRTLDIFLEIPENLSGQVSSGMVVNLFARAVPDWQGKTVITAVIPSADNASRRQLVRVTLNNPPPELLPGMAIQADLEIPLAVNNGFVVPRDALTRRGNQWLLFTVENEQAQQLEVEMLGDLGAEVIVSNPQLQVGQAIVLRGSDGLQNNSAVKVVSN